MKLKPIVVLLLASSPLFAATSLKDAVEQTILRNPEVRAKWQAFKAAGYEREAAKGNYLPRLDLNAYTGVENQERPKTSTGSFDHHGASLELRQLLFDGGTTRDDVRRLGYGRLTRYYELLAASDDAALQTTSAYLDILRFRELVKLARENYAIHKETHDQIAERVGAGVGRRVDLETAAGRLALAESNWLTEASNLHDVSARYERLTGVMPDEALLPPDDLAAKAPADLQTLRTAVEQNAQFRASVFNIRAARAEATSKKGAYYPQFELRASQGYDRNRDGIDGSYSDSAVQLVMNYNLFRGGSDKARVNQYAEQLSLAQELRDKTCRDIRQTTRIAWNDTKRLKEQLRYLEQHALSTEKARDAFRKQFDIGQRSLLDVLDTENELFEARRALVRADYDYKLAYARVLAQTHQLLAALQLSPLENVSPEDDLGDNLSEDEQLVCGGAIPDSVELDRDAAMAGRPARAPAPVPEPKQEAPSPITNSNCGKNITQMVADWAAAWSAKDFDKYRSFYASKFEASKGRNYAAWEAKRRARVTKPGEITVRMDNLNCKVLTADRAEMDFTQFYTSADYKDEVNKTLELLREEGQWKIRKENVTKGRDE